MTMWMVRAESDGSLFQPFLDQSLVAIGWPDVGDVSRFGSREELVAELRQQYPGQPSGWYANAGGMLYRFSNELRAGDGVVTYQPTRRVYAVGKLEGNYRFDPRFNTRYPNVRSVEWSATSSRRAARRALAGLRPAVPAGGRRSKPSPRFCSVSDSRFRPPSASCAGRRPAFQAVPALFLRQRFAEPA